MRSICERLSRHLALCLNDRRNLDFGDRVTGFDPCWKQPLVLSIELFPNSVSLYNSGIPTGSSTFGTETVLVQQVIIASGKSCRSDVICVIQIPIRAVYAA
ncbi:MAG: hypothetical protein DMG62_00345 [Acidobacteria bacterium]|nr:MAG: hypothetical protein DMG62_00345 [Acidobacteriota bacterium]